MYDTFISYRRESGSEVAALIYENLSRKGFMPFYDKVGMESGRFDEQLE